MDNTHGPVGGEGGELCESVAEYTRDADGEGRINLGNSPVPVNTTLHMHAHHLRRELDVGGVLAVARATPEWRAIPHCPLAPALAKYYQSDEEVWARAFAQWTVQRTGDEEGLRELELLAADKWFYVWRDFDRISAAMDEAFIKKGWMKPSTPLQSPHAEKTTQA